MDLLKYINNTDMMITHSQVLLIAFCDNSIMQGGCIFPYFMAYYNELCTFTKVELCFENTEKKEMY